MKAIKTLLAVSALSVAGAASAATTYNVTYSYESPGLAGSSILIPMQGGGSGSAVLDDNGVLLMTLHGQQFSDYSNLYGWSPAYSDVIVDTLVQLGTTSVNAGVYNLVKAGSFTEYTSCVNGPQDALASCSFMSPGVTFAAYGADGFYSAQSFTLNGGTAQFITNGFGITFTTDYVLTAVPLPATVWMFGSGLAGLVGFSRRRKM